jgi:hypothetical protein
MASPSTFAKRMQIRADRFGKNVDRIARRAALAIDQTLVLATPVDTGRARSNWRAQVGSPPSGTIQPYVPGSKLGIGEQANAAAAIQQAAGQVASWRPSTEVPLFISNNVAYIGKLNEGSSKQAPANFVEQAISAGLSAIAGAKVIT